VSGGNRVRAPREGPRPKEGRRRSSNGPVALIPSLAPPSVLAPGDKSTSPLVGPLLLQLALSIARSHATDHGSCQRVRSQSFLSPSDRFGDRSGLVDETNWLALSCAFAPRPRAACGADDLARSQHESLRASTSGRPSRLLQNGRDPLRRPDKRRRPSGGGA
jgi:hypothetical protein